MITRDQVLTNEMVLGTIRGLDAIFTKFDLQSLLFNPKKKSYQVSDKVIVQIDTDKVFVDWKQNKYLYVLAVTYSGICVDVDILFDRDGNILESAKNKAFPGDWNEVEGCKFCCETNCVLTSSMKNGKDTIYSDIRMDCRPEDDLWQIDNEIVYQTGDDINHTFGEWSNTAIDLNYCPICGRKLRKGKPILFRGININNTATNEQKFINAINLINKNDCITFNHTLDKEKGKSLLEDKGKCINDRICDKIDFILANIFLIDNKLIRSSLVNDLEYIVNNSLIWDEFVENHLDDIIKDTLLK